MNNYLLSAFLVLLLILAGCTVFNDGLPKSFKIQLNYGINTRGSGKDVSQTIIFQDDRIINATRTSHRYTDPYYMQNFTKYNCEWELNRDTNNWDIVSASAISNMTNITPVCPPVNSFASSLTPAYGFEYGIDEKFNEYTSRTNLANAINDKENQNKNAIAIHIPVKGTDGDYIQDTDITYQITPLN